MHPVWYTKFQSSVLNIREVKRLTANANLCLVTKFPLYLSFTVHYFYTYISSFMQFLMHTNCFELFLSAHFLFWEILNLSLTFVTYLKLKFSIYFRLSGFQSSLLLIYFRDGHQSMAQNLSDINNSPFLRSAWRSCAPSQKSRHHNRSTVVLRDVLVGTGIG